MIPARLPLLVAIAVAVAHLGGVAGATNTQVPGKSLIVKAGKLTKFVSKPVGAFPLPAPGSGGDPTTADASFSVVDDGNNAQSFFADLPPGQWKGLGIPAGTKGYKYKGAGTIADPCKVIVVKGNVIKAVCKDDQRLEPPFVGVPAVKLRLGADSYGARFAGATLKNQPGLFRSSGAPACTPSGLCCEGRGFHAFTTATAGGDCGDVVQSDGSPYINHPDLACSGVYFGGGGNSVPLPLAFSTQEQSVTAITSCIGQTAMLGPTTSADTTSNRNCTAPGCLFGPPLPLPNAGSTPTSVCVIFAVSGAATGMLDCDSGAQDLDLPLSADVFLTGDTATDPGQTIPGIQSCPICATGSCIGGSRNGLACIPAGDSGSTSHDCPPDPMFNIGSVPVAFALSSGTVSWTATVATNDTEVEFNQTRVFAGFCRDADGSGCFQGAPGCLSTGPQRCWENGTAVGSPCTQPFETCEQRANGAFGPAGGAVQTITAYGQPQDGIACGATTGVLVSLFAVPPTLDVVVNAAADFPGPAAVTIPVAGALCDTASTCPLSGPCGDGVCAAFESCLTCPGDCGACPFRLAFITSGAFSGAAIGGLAGADAKCDQEAQAGGLPGSYKAWMSDSVTSASDRFTHSTTPYVMPNGIQIADDWTDLTDGDIDAPLTRKADGTDRGLGGAWTATSPSGGISYPANTCADWTSDSGLGADGYSGASNGDWTTNSVQPLDFCSVSSPLYCFQQ